MNALPGARDVPFGPGLIVRTLRLVPEEAVHLRAILVGYDGLASAHSTESDLVVLTAPEDREAELDAWLRDVAQEIAFEMVAVDFVTMPA
jgi:hypothetical protein